MKLNTRQDIEAPVEFVHAQIADFEMWERAALRRGAEVTRDDPDRTPGPGTWWDARFRFRGRDRALRLTLLRHEPGQHLAFRAEGASAEANMTLDLVELGARRTRVVVGVQITPRTMAARLFLQGLKLAGKRVQQRFDGRVAQLAAQIETRYRPMPRR